MTSKTCNVDVVCFLLPAPFIISVVIVQVGIMKKLDVSRKSILITYIIFLKLAEYIWVLGTISCVTKKMCTKVTPSQMTYFNRRSLQMCLDGKN